MAKKDKVQESIDLLVKYDLNEWWFDNYDKVNTKRLKRLGNHIKGGKLAHKKFDMCILNGTPIVKEIHGTADLVIADPEINTVGTNGCMIGELPKVWPKQWYWGEVASVLLKDVDVGITKSSYRNQFIMAEQVMEWFGIDSGVYNKLFFCKEDDVNRYNRMYHGNRIWAFANHIEQIMIRVEAYIKDTTRQQRLQNTLDTINAINNAKRGNS